MSKFMLHESDKTHIMSLYGLLSESAAPLTIELENGKLSVNDKLYSLSIEKAGSSFKTIIDKVENNGGVYKIIGKHGTPQMRMEPFEILVTGESKEFMNDGVKQNQNRFSISKKKLGDVWYAFWMKKEGSSSKTPSSKKTKTPSNIKCPNNSEPFDMGKYSERNNIYCKTSDNTVIKYAMNGYPFAEYVKLNDVWVVYFDEVEKEGENWDKGPITLSKGLNDFLNSKISQ